MRKGVEEEKCSEMPWQDMVAVPSPAARRGEMTEAGLAVFVLAAFVIPIPVLVWLDRPRWK